MDYQNLVKVMFIDEPLRSKYVAKLKIYHYRVVWEAIPPPGKTQYPLYRRLGGPQSRSGQVQKISPTPAFDPQTVQPVANHHAD